MSTSGKKNVMSYLCASKNYSVLWFYGEMVILLLLLLLLYRVSVPIKEKSTVNTPSWTRNSTHDNKTRTRMNTLFCKRVPIKIHQAGHVK